VSLAAPAGDAVRWPRLDHTMPTCDPSELLYRLHNEITLEQVIVKHLDWPCERRDGRFVFVCPRCGESLTAVNPRTNIGSCFRCKEDFNAIDFVMLATHRVFVEAADFLDALLPSASVSSPSAPSSD
jgi:hypothetical protein